MGGGTGREGAGGRGQGWERCKHVERNVLGRAHGYHTQTYTEHNQLTAMGGRSSVPSEELAEGAGGGRGKGDW